MKFALISNGIVDTVAMDRPGHFADETYKEDVQVEREVLTEQQKLDGDGKPVFDGDMPVMETVAILSTVTETVEKTRPVFVADGRFVECPDDVFAGFLFRKGKFSPPPAPKPSTDPNDFPLNRFQFEAFVMALGMSMANIEGAIDGLKITDFDKAVGKSRLRNATTYNRSHPLVEMVRGALNMQVETLDATWLMAKDLR